MTNISIMQRLVSGSLLRVLSFAAQVAVGMLMVPFILGSLGDEMYGLWSLLSAFLAYGAILDFGLLDAISRFMAQGIAKEDEEDCNSILSTSLLIYTGLGVFVFLIVVILIVFVDDLFAMDDPNLLYALIAIMGASLAFEFPFRSLAGLLHAKLRFDVLAALNLAGLALRTLLIVMALNAGYGILGLAGATLLGKVPGRLLHLYYCRKSFPGMRISRRFCTWGTARRIFSVSSYAFLARVADLLRFQTDILLISVFLGLAVVAHYRIAGALVFYFITLMATAIGVIFPVLCSKFREKEDSAFRGYLLFSTRLSICISSFIAFGFIAWGAPFISKWVGSEYLDAYPCLVMLALAAVFDKWQHPIPMALLAAGRQRLVAGLSLAEGILNLFFSVLFVQFIGMLGVALGSLIASFLVRLLLQPVAACRVLPIDYPEYVGQLAKTLRNVTASLVLPAIFSVFAAESYSNLLIIGLTSLLCYVTGLWMIEFNRRETLIIRTLVPLLRVKSSP